MSIEIWKRLDNKQRLEYSNPALKQVLQTRIHEWDLHMQDNWSPLH